VRVAAVEGEQADPTLRADYEVRPTAATGACVSPFPQNAAPWVYVVPRVAPFQLSVCARASPMGARRRRGRRGK
jgi:hypothetical protein